MLSYNGSLKSVCGYTRIPRVTDHMFVGAKNMRRKSCIKNEEHMSNTLLPYTVWRRKLNRGFFFELLRASNRVDVLTLAVSKELSFLSSCSSGQI
jgi:hypothetical protein